MIAVLIAADLVSLYARYNHNWLNLRGIRSLGSRQSTTTEACQDVSYELFLGGSYQLGSIPWIASDMAGPQNACILNSIICVKLWRHIRSQRGVAFLYSAMSTVPSVLSRALGDSASGTAFVGSVSDLAMMKNVKQETSMLKSHRHQAGMSTAS